VAGTRYEARAWIRSETPGKKTCLRVREWRSGSVVGSADSCRTPTSSWAKFDTVLYTAVGGDSLELYAYEDNAVAGDSFDLDGVTLTAP
jgi:hypothetical protein